MGIFRRGTKERGTADTSSTGKDRAGSHRAGGGSEARDTAVISDSSSIAEATSKAASSRQALRRGGPFDRSEVESLEGRLDLGALWLTGLPGMELRLEVEEESQNVVGVTAVMGESAVQLQAFAAPRSEGVWDDIRTEIAASITGQGGTADKMSGPLGLELRAQMPGQGPDGRTVFSSVRFVGIDGPRWFLRAVLSGPAAVDDGAASSLLDVVRATVVVRGDEAMAPRELLALKLPDQPDDEAVASQEQSGQSMTSEGAADGARPEGNAAGGAPHIDDLKPFERGPEITEIH